MIDNSGNSVYMWWKNKEDEAYQDVFSYIEFLDKDQSYRQNENFKNMKLYGNYDLYNLRSYQYLRAEPSVSVHNRVTLNVIQSMIDTVTSKITKNKPKATFLTEGGDFSQQQRAKKLTQFVEGQFQMTEFYQKAAMAFQDACVFGTGALKIFRGGPGNSELKVERVFIDELIVDDRESFYGEPRQVHQRKFIHKDVLKQMFPDYATAIDMVGSNSVSRYTPTANRNPDMVLVIESWHLRSGPDADDGKHVISIENQTLFSEKYDKDYFPFVFWRWGVRPLGFYGQGLAEQLTGIQIEINKILRTIQVSMHLVSVPKVYVEASSKIVTAHLDNKIGGIVKYAGQPPIPGPVGTVPAELFTHLDRLYARAYEIAGISQLSATAQKPAGLNSGKALREYNDLESERFMSVAQRYERCFIDAARIMVDLTKDIADDTGNFTVKTAGNKFLKTIKWSEVSMEQDEYIMHIFPTSALSSTPAGRLQDVQELIQAGFIGREDAISLLDLPDLRSFYNYGTAAGEDINRLIEQFIDDGEYQTPEPFQNLEYGIQKMQMAYLYFKSEGASEDRLELFRRWIQDATTLKSKAMLEAAKQQMQAQAATQELAAAQAQAEVPAEAAPEVNAEEPMLPPDETMQPT